MTLVICYVVLLAKCLRNATNCADNANIINPLPPPSSHEGRVSLWGSKLTCHYRAIQIAKLAICTEMRRAGKGEQTYCNLVYYSCNQSNLRDTCRQPTVQGEGGGRGMQQKSKKTSQVTFSSASSSSSCPNAFLIRPETFNSSCPQLR